MLLENGKYYLYRHIRLDNNLPFYIGIGTFYNKTSFKMCYKRAVALDGRNKLWNRLVNKYGYKIEIFGHNDDLEFIKTMEKYFINLYGRIDLKMGILVNMTDGGDGAFNHIHLEETKIKCRETKLKRNKKRTSAQRKHMSDIMKNRVFTEEWKSKISKSKQNVKCFTNCTNRSKRILKISTNIAYSSITKLSKEMEIRKEKIHQDILNNPNSDYRIITETEYFAITKKRNWRKSSLYNILHHSLE